MLPIIWSSLRDIFPALRNWGYRSTANSRSAGVAASGTHNSNIKMHTYGRKSSEDMDRGGSQEQIVPRMEIEISKDTTFSVEENSIADEERTDSAGRQPDGAFAGHYRPNVVSHAFAGPR